VAGAYTGVTQTEERCGWYVYRGGSEEWLVRIQVWLRLRRGVAGTYTGVAQTEERSGWCVYRGGSD
jgi:hypothetical protein